MRGIGVEEMTYNENKNPLTGKGDRHSKSAAISASLGISKAQIPPRLSESDEKSLLDTVSNMRKTILEKYNFPDKEPFTSLKQKLANDVLAEDAIKHITQLISFALKKDEEAHEQNIMQ